MSRRQLFLFGMPQLVGEGQRVNIERRRSLALLAYLAVTRQPHSRDLLAAMFWPEHDTTHARAGLRRELHNLKKALPEDFLDSSGEHAGLAQSAQLWVDVHEFESLLEHAREHGHNLDSRTQDEACRQCLPRLEAAATLYKADFMAGFSLSDSTTFDDWQFFQGEKLRQALAQTLQRLSAWQAWQGNYPAAVEHARRWLALDNLHEAAQRELMQLYYLSGQQAAALRQYQECQRLLQEELGVDPETETIELYQAIQSRQLARPGIPALERPEPIEATPDHSQQIAPAVSIPTRQHNLPSVLTPIIGREGEMTALTVMLSENPTCRLLTLIGPGGSGKTRLALETARLLAETSQPVFADGVWFVNLVPLNRSSALLPTIAQSLGIPISGDQAQRQQQTLDYLQSKSLLILLDNIEHLIDSHSSDLVTTLLSRSAGTRILVTSRARLNLRAERLFSVEGLPVPPENAFVEGDLPDHFSEYSALELFRACVSRLDPGFQINRDNYQAVARICRLVQGMPLGIELASTWMELLSPQDIVTEIERSLDFLESNWDDVPARQRSLRAVFDSSWKLLKDEQRRSIASLSVFQGSFTRQAAESAAGASLSMLLTLVNKSWLQRTQSESVNRGVFHDPGALIERYQIHELLRQYATEKLKSDLAAFQQANDGHLRYYASFLSQQAQLMRGPQQKEAFRALEMEFENIRAAWNWGVGKSEFSTLIYEMLPAIYVYCEARARTEELLSLVESAQRELEKLPQEEPNASLIAILLTVRAAFFGDLYPVRFEAYGLVIQGGIDALRQAWSKMGDLAILISRGFWGIMLTYLYGRIVAPEEGVKYLRQLALSFEDEDQPWEQALSLYFLGNLLEIILTREPDNPSLLAETSQSLSAALSIFIKLGDEREGGNTQRALGRLAHIERNLQAAIEHWRAAQQQLLAVGETALAVDISTNIGDAQLALGEFARAFRCYQEVRQFYEQRGDKRLAAYRMSKESFEMVRYGDLEGAIRLREKALGITRALRDEYGEAWNTWEMGDAYRVMGDFSTARHWFEQAHNIFQKVHEPLSIIFYHRGMGDLALAEGDYATAQTQFQSSFRRAVELDHNWMMSYALSGLSRAEIGLGEYSLAEAHLSEALAAAVKIGQIGVLLLALSAMAELYAASGKIKQALELADMVKNHYASWKEVKARAAALLAALPQPAHPPAEEPPLLDPWQIAADLIKSNKITTRRKPSQ
jgi:predicted ATPase/DNA-binding SARP family transcriptional activator